MDLLLAFLILVLHHIALTMSKVIELPPSPYNLDVEVSDADWLEYLTMVFREEDSYRTISAVTAQVKLLEQNASADSSSTIFGTAAGQPLYARPLSKEVSKSNTTSYTYQVQVSKSVPRADALKVVLEAFAAMKTFLSFKVYPGHQILQDAALLAVADSSLRVEACDIRYKSAPNVSVIQQFIERARPSSVSVEIADQTTMFISNEFFVQIADSNLTSLLFSPSATTLNDDVLGNLQLNSLEIGIAPNITAEGLRQWLNTSFSLPAEERTIWATLSFDPGAEIVEKFDFENDTSSENDTDFRMWTLRSVGANNVKRVSNVSFEVFLDENPKHFLRVAIDHFENACPQSRSSIMLLTLIGLFEFRHMCSS